MRTSPRNRLLTVKKFYVMFVLMLCLSSALLLGGFGRKETDALPVQAGRRPNIIIILADDLGFSDLGCYGGEIATPNLDRLARGGARLTSFYNTSRCCPTRASLLTGLYPHQAGVGRMTLNEGQPGYRGTLTPNTVTIAEVLRSAGYQTGIVGKWHLSETIERPTKAEHLNWLAHRAEPGDFADPNSYPTARGFDRFYGTIWGVVDYFDPFSLVSGNQPVRDVPPNFYYTNAIGDSAVSFVDGFAKSSKLNAARPFFLYIAHTAPHWPVQALPEDIRKYEKTYQDGWQALRQRRYDRLVAQKLIDPATTPLPAFMFPKADWTRDSTQAWDARAMAVHAAMVDRLDQTIGKLVAKLTQTGQLDNTLILFLSDNGASSENPSAYGPGFDRAGSTRDGRTVAFPTKKEVMPGGQLVHAGIGEIWAHAINTPFRYYKAKLHEGGITTPLIAHWPAGIRPGPGGEPRILDEPTHVIDLMATCLDLAQTKYPATYGGRTITPTPGKSLVPMLRAGAVPAQRLHPTLFWEHFGAAAFREGDWKIVRLTQNDSWELYDLKCDRSETTNLANTHPERVVALAQQWEAAAREYQVYPKPGKTK